MNAVPAHHQFPASEETIPRFREAGDLTLDLYHRDGRVDDCWLALRPREFALLWRLAQQPGVPVPGQQLITDVWRIPFEPEAGSLAAQVAQVRAKLEPFGLAALIAQHPDEGYFLDAPPAAGRALMPGG